MSAIIAGVLTIGTALASTDFNLPDGVPVNVNDGDLNINEGRFVLNNSTFIADRNDGAQTAFILRNEGKQSSFIFDDLDDLHKYSIRFTQDGARFELFDTTRGQADIIIRTSDGNVGIGNNNPIEQLDVNGNIRLNGNIVSPGDICIGSC